MANNKQIESLIKKAHLVGGHMNMANGHYILGKFDDARDASIQSNNSLQELIYDLEHFKNKRKTSFLKRFFKSKHEHAFDPMDVIDLSKDPECSCGMTLPELQK